MLNGRYKFLFFVIAVFFPARIAAQNLTIDNSGLFYQIAPIFDFRQGIVSLTFDDASINQFLVALPMLREKKIPATFYVVTDYLDSLIDSILLNNLSDDVEIGSHTVSHPDFRKSVTYKIIDELTKSKEILQEKFGPDAGLTMSYPWGIYNNQIIGLVKNLYWSARTTGQGYNSLSKLKRYELLSKGFDEHIGIDDANGWVNFAILNKYWLIEMIHGIDSIGFSPIDSRVLGEHLDYINQIKSKIWCSTVSNVLKYIDESKSTTVQCDLCNDTVFKVRIDDLKDDSVYKQPVSFRVKIPDTWEEVTINGKRAVKTEIINESKFIYFNSLPDNKMITIRPKTISENNADSGLRIIYMSENPFNESVKLSVEALDMCDIKVLLCDMNGRVLLNQQEKNALGVINVEFDTTVLKAGIYFLRISDSQDYLLTKKLLKN